MSMEWLAQYSQTLTGFLESSLHEMPLLAYPVSFIAGLLASLTPCIYPVIPIVAGYIGGEAKGSRRRGFSLSVFYVIGMAIVYSALGAFAALSGRIFGEVQSSPVAYIIVANAIIFFGLSMLGAVVLPIPSFLKNQSGKGRKTSGAIGMGIASGLITAPCTAPVAGTLLTYVASRQNVLFGVSLLFTFAAGMGILLILVGTSAGLLTSLPKSGAWMEKIKKGLGIFMILLGEYFLIRAGKLLF